MKIFRRRQVTANTDDGPIHLTQEGLKRLEERLARLKLSLPGFISEAQRTANFGDRSDNAEYKEAKSTLRRAHGQIWSIEDQLKRAVIIKTGRSKTGIVQLGCTVVLESKNKTRKVFQILGPHETDPGKGRISHLSPLGKALINHIKGDVVAIETPNGPHEYLIVEVR